MSQLGFDLVFRLLVGVTRALQLLSTCLFPCLIGFEGLTCINRALSLLSLLFSSLIVLYDYVSLFAEYLPRYVDLAVQSIILGDTRLWTRRPPWPSLNQVNRRSPPYSPQQTPVYILLYIFHLELPEHESAEGVGESLLSRFYRRTVAVIAILRSMVYSSVGWLSCPENCANVG